MATLGDIVTKVQSKLVEGGGNLAAPTQQQIIDQINSVIGYYTSNQWWFTEETATGLCTIGDPLLPVPDDFGQFLQPDAIVIEQNNVRYPLLQVNPLTYDSLFVGGNGMPRYFLYADQTIQLYFPPDQAYIYYIHYKKTYPALVDLDDTNDFLTFCPRLIEYHTLGDCFSDYRSDQDMAMIYLGQDMDGGGGKVKKEYLSVQAQHYDRTATGNLATENITGRSRSTIFER